ncbi:unnamed protein product [Taenia asiatica]|uniref:RRM domain-containing protein n=1 Tax=Taenia asiatica TaxID=60517 RepID=A0A0R3VZF5_TAEAS|nr:unnamed protein product [Taenia asiatica]
MYSRGEDSKMGSNGKAAGTGARRKVDSPRLFVCNLSHCTTQRDLKELFSHYGNATSINLIRERGSRMLRGIAFVKMSTPQEVKAALQSRPHHLNGRRIVVRQAYSRSSGSNNKVKADIVSTQANTFRAPISGLHSSTKSNWRKDLKTQTRIQVTVSLVTYSDKGMQCQMSCAKYLVRERGVVRV